MPCFGFFWGNYLSGKNHKVGMLEAVSCLCRSQESKSSPLRFVQRNLEATEGRTVLVLDKTNQIRLDKLSKLNVAR